MSQRSIYRRFKNSLISNPDLFIKRFKSRPAENIPLTTLSKMIALTSLSLEAILRVFKISSKKSMLNALEG